MTTLYLLLFSLLTLSLPISLLSLPTFSISLSPNHTSIIICSLMQQNHHLNCKTFKGLNYNYTTTTTNISAISFSGVVGGDGFFCGLDNHQSNIICWRFDHNGVIVEYKRIYDGPVLDDLDSGNSRICGVVRGTGRLECWQWRKFKSSVKFSSLAVGGDFVCGLKGFGKIRCVGNLSSAGDGRYRGNFSVVAAGLRHFCAISVRGRLKCWGDLVGDQPKGLFKGLALGDRRSCGIRVRGDVVCWGEDGFRLPEVLEGTSFEAIEASGGVFCGVRTEDYGLYCWGNEVFDADGLVFQDVVPGACRRECPCGTSPGNGRFCRQGLMGCKPCDPVPTVQNPESPPRSKGSGINWTWKNVTLLVVGCVGTSSSVILLFVLCFRYKKASRGSHRVHDSGPLDDIEMPSQPTSTKEVAHAQQTPPVLVKRLSQMFSMENGGNLEDFSFSVLVRATNDFSNEHKIGSGSFGSVYRATLQDGREVAIKRAQLTMCPSFNGAPGGGNATITKRQDENEYAFVNELECLSRLNHKNLVRLLGFCEDCNEYALIYEYMDNGSLHDHLHNPQSTDTMSWPTRIQVALDAARGIEYLHVYADPPIIHRDIKSSNILLNATWTAKVSDFGLSLMGPQENMSHLSLHAAGTVGYIDPEYFRLQQLTTKSDVYSFGVLLLELLSGYKAIHLNEERMPRNVVDYVVPYIVQDNIHRILDPRLPPPTPLEIEAIAYIGYLATDCVMLPGQDRPTMSEIVNSLERALLACFATPPLSHSSTNSSL
ncbi:serine/threonine-protein kinase-like protein CCR4 [Heracleum sosnowskyi]|uniref:Serine/threonine-protein kinase-like protein CCR4 n=1 Tax=Heracleum sosnowskyi TaxID=360622 RepID=A0AAD8H6G5_9APIA|nr:serine/threonine-protein kinase-like protein CCR4 [Heracleum sosnowskyi]